jgi:hypothetical protein
VRVPLRHPVSSRRWDIGATWSRSGGGAAALGACGSEPSMIAEGLGGRQIPLSPTRRRAWGKWSGDLTHG